jgi:hypothetical protein
VVVLRANRFALDTRIATIALALVLAAVSMPMMCGWVVADSRCAITMDICHAAQSIEVSGAAWFVPAPQLFTLASPARDSLRVTDHFYQAIDGRLGEAPDPPPPKTLA